MKNSFLLLSVLLLTLFGSSCKKDSWINEDKAAEVLASSLEQKSGGLARDVDMQTTYWLLNLALIPCEDSVSVTRNFNYDSGGNVANANYLWNVRKQCDGSEVYLTWTSDFSGDYDFTRAKGTWQGQRIWTATQLDSSFESWKLNGTCTRSGNHESKVSRRQTFDSQEETVFTDVLVDKSTRRLVGGTATSVVNITSNSGETYQFNIVTTVSADGIATIVVNGNTTVTVNLY